MVLPQLCLFLAANLYSQAKPSEFKGVEYTLPTNWQVQQSAEVLILTPNHLDEGKIVAVIVAPPIPKSGKPWLDNFNVFLAAAGEKTHVVSHGETQSTKRPPYEIFVQLQKLKDDNIGDYQCLYQMVADDDNGACMCVMSNDDALVEKYQKDLSQILLSSRPKKAAKKIRTGDTPGLYLGSPGWLPSGRGTEIPKAHLVDGKPTGMWMNAGFELNSKSAIFATIYLPDGTMVRFPRFGGGNLIDIEGERANPNDAKSVGTWSVGNGTMTTHISGGNSTFKYSTGKDDEGEFFLYGGAKYRPCIPVTADYLVGKWHIPGAGEYEFAKDGTVKYSFSFQPENGPDRRSTGTWVLDGYLFAVDQPNLYIVNSIYRFGTDSIVIGEHIYSRVK